MHESDNRQIVTNQLRRDSQIREREDRNDNVQNINNNINNVDSNKDEKSNNSKKDKEDKNYSMLPELRTKREVKIEP